MTAVASDPVERFAFGANWLSFLESIDERRIAVAVASLREFLGIDRLDGQTFLDLGCGSGLFSLAAVRMGAVVRSVDVDEQCVECTAELRRRFAPSAADWKIERGDATDASFMAGLGSFDVVYSWGVLHHTGRMWQAMDSACGAVAPHGRLFISIYNDQGKRSRIWRGVKRRYQRVPEPLRPAYVVATMLPRELLAFAAHAVRGHPATYVRGWTEYRRNRGMSRWHDLVDWVGGYPFEVARPEQVFDFCRARGLDLDRLRTAGGGLGCNQFVFVRSGARAVSPPRP